MGYSQTIAIANSQRARAEEKAERYKILLENAITILEDNYTIAEVLKELGMTMSEHDNIMGITYEVNTLGNDGQVIESESFEDRDKAIKFYNKLKGDKELNRNFADEDFDNLYSYFTADNSGTKIIDESEWR